MHLAPRAANARTIPAPIPPDPPVISTTFPAKSRSPLAISPTIIGVAPGAPRPLSLRQVWGLSIGGRVMANSVYLIGASRTDFKRNLRKEGKSLRDVIVESARAAIADAQIQPNDVQ